MARKRSGSQLPRSILPTAIAGAGGAGVGYLTGRTAASAGAKAMTILAENLARQSALSTTGPVIASGVMGGALILAAALIPLTLVWAMKKENPHAAKKEEDKDTEIH